VFAIQQTTKYPCNSRNIPGLPQCWTAIPSWLQGTDKETPTSISFYNALAFRQCVIACLLSKYYKNKQNNQLIHLISYFIWHVIRVPNFTNCINVRDTDGAFEKKSFTFTNNSTAHWSVDGSCWIFAANHTFHSSNHLSIFLLEIRDSESFHFKHFPKKISPAVYYSFIQRVIQFVLLNILSKEIHHLKRVTSQIVQKYWNV